MNGSKAAKKAMSKLAAQDNSREDNLCGLKKYLTMCFPRTNKIKIGSDIPGIPTDLTITRAALGNSASLGDLYDARRDILCGAGVFKRSIPATARTLQDTPFAEYQLVRSDQYSEKFSKMDISAELQASFLGGTLSPKGSGKYLNDRKQTSRALNMSVIYNVKTKDESVNIFHDDLKEVFSVEALKANMGTHIVVGITWGANLALTCAYENMSNQDTTEVEGTLGANLNLFCASISGSAAVKFDEGDKTTGEKFQIRMYCDVLPEKEELPTTFETALEFVRNLPSLLGAYNEGKGKPILLHLLPVSILMNYLGVKIDIDTTITEIEKAAVTQVVQMFDEMSTIQQEIQSYYGDVQKYAELFPSKDRESIRDFRQKFLVFGNGIRGELSKLLTDIRSGKADSSKLDDVMQKFYKSEFASNKVSEKLEYWNTLMRQITFVKLLGSHGVYLLKQGESLSDKFLDLDDMLVYVLFYNKTAEFYPQNLEAWTMNTESFLKEARKQSQKTAYFAVDCDIHPDLAVVGLDVCVRVYKDGELLVENLFGKSPARVSDIFKSTPDKVMWLSAETTSEWSNIPRYAVYAGMDSKDVPNYVCRTQHYSDVLFPGSLCVNHYSMIPYFNGHTSTKFEVLVCPPWGVSWVKVLGNDLPENAILAGFSTGNNLYIGRAQCPAGMICGAVAVDSQSKYVQGLYVSSSDLKTFIIEKDIEVLVRNDLGIKYDI